MIWRPGLGKFADHVFVTPSLPSHGHGRITEATTTDHRATKEIDNRHKNSNVWRRRGTGSYGAWPGTDIGEELVPYPASEKHFSDGKSHRAKHKGASISNIVSEPRYVNWMWGTNNTSRSTLVKSKVSPNSSECTSTRGDLWTNQPDDIEDKGKNDLSAAVVARV